jgi:hypothetical protein
MMIGDDDLLVSEELVDFESICVPIHTIIPCHGQRDLVAVPKAIFDIEFQQVTLGEYYNGFHHGRNIMNSVRKTSRFCPEFVKHFSGRSFLGSVRKTSQFCPELVNSFSCQFVFWFGRKSEPRATGHIIICGTTNPLNLQQAVFWYIWR